MMPCNYRTIMIGHYLAKLYRSIRDSELSICAEQNGCNSVGQAGFQKGFTTLDYIFTLRALIEEGRTHNKRIYATLWISEKPLTLPRARFMQRLEALGVPTDTQWGIYALYESASGKVRSSKGL